ncbi:FadR/GntR family transcriptional regulator [Phytohabitans suffuscus]|uniref:GntR family transcriptional regulator n=1 Tax=Phytohabitans suffuscus TaxID=624315 RepID=A0A6F8YR57_9ACTN|nr:FCD domain-containing protein [Phytohabitans suffuscus]BCB88584.1 GntR family transcriptional regulator [Phytohabitans suffuscus]
MAEVVALELRRQIVKGELQESEALPSEAALMAEFGVSRPTLREAFRVLESESLITVRRGAHGGARVNAPSPDVAARYAALVLEHRGTTLQDVLTARSIIEPACVRRLAEIRTDEDLAKLRAAVKLSRSTVAHPVEQMTHQTNFHALVVELAGNKTLALLASILRQIIAVANHEAVEAEATSAKNTRALRRGFRAHEKVVDFIEARDGESAVQLWRTHLLEAEDYLLQGHQKLTVLDLME